MKISKHLASFIWILINITVNNALAQDSTGPVSQPGAADTSTIQDKNPNVVLPYIGVLQYVDPDCMGQDGQTKGPEGAAIQNAANAAQSTHYATEVVKDHTQAKDAACLPVLEDLGKMISLSVPCFTCGLFSELLDKIKQAACAAANSAISRTLGNFNVAYTAPYGLGGFKVGVSTSGEQYKAQDVNPFSQIEQQAIGLGSDLGRQAATDVTGSMPKVDGINRRLRNSTNQLDGQVPDWRKQANDVFKNL